jgi:secondary thiamine-phosphate synthase enzyme
MSVVTANISLDTQGDTDVHDISSELNRLVEESGLRAGILTVFCPSSTSAVTTLEFEHGALSDLKRMFEELVPVDHKYAHNPGWEDTPKGRHANGHSHMRASLLGPSLTIPFTGKTLTLGTWQQVIFVEFDSRPRHRELVVQMIGE